MRRRTPPLSSLLGDGRHFLAVRKINTLDDSLSSSVQRPPLEAQWVEHPLVILVEGRPVTGVARANWGAIETTITSPFAGLTRGRDGRGWLFAMECHHCPERQASPWAGGSLTTASGRA